MFTTTPAFAVRQSHCRNYMQSQLCAFAEPHEQGVFTPAPVQKEEPTGVVAMREEPPAVVETA